MKTRSSMKSTSILLIIILLVTAGFTQKSAKDIYNLYQDKICLVSFYQNIASEAKIGSFDKIKRYRIGIVVSPDGLIMVSSDVYPVSLDVVSSGTSFLSGLPTEFKVKFSDNKEYPARFLGKDDQAEVAFLELQDLGADLKLDYVQFAKTQNVRVGENIYVLELLSQSYEFNHLFSEYLINAIVETPRRKFLVNNSTTALSGGGLVLDDSGQAIGVTLNQSFNFSFATPGDFEDFHKDYLEIAPSEWFLESIANPPNLQENEAIPRSWLGIRMQGLNEQLQKYWKVPQAGGVVVNEVYPESPAARAKLIQGDVILVVDDSVLLVKDDDQTAKLRNLVREYPPDTKIKMKIFRDGQVITRTVKLEAAPKSISLADKYAVPKLGFELRELTRDILYQSDLPLNTPGAFVFQVDRASPAGIGGLQIGDIVQEINNSPVKDITEAKAVLGKSQEEGTTRYMFKVLSDRETRFVFIDLKK